MWALKMTDLKMTDHRNVQAWNWRTWKWRTWKCRTCFTCLNRPTWNRLRFSSAPPCHPGIPPQSLHVPGTPATRYDGVHARTTWHGLTNGLRIKRAKKKMNLINERRIKACVGRFDAGSYICLSIILQLQEVYTTYLAAVTCVLPLFWKELHTALYCNLFSNDIYLVLQFHVRHFHVRQFHAWTLGRSISCPSFSVNASIYTVHTYTAISSNHLDTSLFRNNMSRPLTASSPI